MQQCCTLISIPCVQGVVTLLGMLLTPSVRRTLAQIAVHVAQVECDRLS